MYYKKSEFPEEGDIVLCTVKEILSHSVFVDLDEYDKKEGMIRVSEVSPGRIRTLSDFVREGKKIACKVISLNKEKSHIDLSLRRVSISERVKKLKDYKQEEKSEKLLEIVGKEAKYDLKKIYEKFGYNALENYGSLTAFLQAVYKDGIQLLEKFNVPKELIEPL